MAGQGGEQVSSYGKKLIRCGFFPGIFGKKAKKHASRYCAKKRDVVRLTVLLRGNRALIL